MNKAKMRNKWIFAIILNALGVLPCTHVATGQERNNFSFKGRFQGGHSPDSVTFYVWDSFLSEEKKEFVPHRKLIVPVKGNMFTCKTVVDSNRYISLGWGSYSGVPVPYLELYQVAPGDSIDAIIQFDDKESNFIKDDSGNPQCINCFNFFFKGRGAPKYTAQLEINNSFESLYREWSNIYETIPKKDTNRQFHDILIIREQGDWFSQKWLKILNKYKDELTIESYSQLVVDVLSRSWLIAFGNLTYSVSGFDKLPSKYGDSLKKIIKYSGTRLNSFTSKFLVYSPYFSELKVLQARMGNPKELPSKTLDRIVQHNRVDLKDRIITNYIYNNESNWNTEERKEVFVVTRKLVTKEPYASALRKMDVMQKGAKVYDFALPDTLGNIVKLSDFKGKVVFIDFWFVGCMGCIEYYKGIVSKAENLFKDNQNVVFITISIDVNKEKWLGGIKSGKYTSGDVINLHAYPTGANHPVIQQFGVNTYPHPLLIDREGRVFSNSDMELRETGIDGLVKKIEEALKKNNDYSQTTGN